MRGTKADVERYISTFQGASPSQKARPDKGFLFAKLYFEAEEYELAKRHVSEYLTIQPKDPNAHKFLGQLFELDGETDKAVGCYKTDELRVALEEPAPHPLVALFRVYPPESDTQPNLVLKVAELLCGKPDHDSRAEFWVDKAARLLPGNPAVFNLREKLLSAQSGSNQLYKRLHSELKLQPADTHINRKLVQLYNTDGRLEDAVKHCLTVEKAGILRDSLEWYELLVSTLQEYVCQPSVSSNKLVSRKFHKELLLAKCSCVRLTLALKGCEESTAALWSFDCAMQALKNTATNMADELAEVFTEMRAHLYLYAGTLLLKRAQDRGQQWRTVVDLATFCYLISYQAPRPKAKCFNGEQVSHEPLELLACDRQSQAGHMLLNLSPDVEQLLKDVVKAFGNRSSLGPLFYELFGVQTQKQPSFICNDDIHVLSVHPPKPMDLAKWDSGAVLLHAGDLQQLSWLGLQWALMGKSASLQDWLKQLFPLLMLETSKLDTNAPESICLLDLEVFVCGVVFCSQMQLEEKANMPSCSKPHEPRCLPLHIMKQLLSDRQREWWDAVYSLIHKRELPEMTAKVRLVVQLGLSTLRAQEEHGLQPALLIHWAKHLIDAAERVNSFYDQKDYAGRSVHYWKVVLPLLEKVRQKRCIPKPLRPMFMHFRSRDIQPSQVQVYEEDADKSLATLLDIEGNTEEAIANLEKLDSISSNWHLETIYRRLSEQAGNGLEETPGRCTNFLQKFRKFLSKIYEANAEDMEKLPASMEEVMELLNEVNQQLEDVGETEDQVDYPLTSSPCQPTEGHVKFSPPSPFKSVTSPSTRSVFSPKTPPHWVEDQQSMLQMLCQQVEALKNEVHDLRHNSSNAAPSSNRMQQDNYAAEGLQETFPAAQTFHSVPLTDSEVTLEREEQSTANKEQRASSDSNTEAEKSDEFNTELQKLQEAQVKPNPSHDAVAVDTHDGRVEEHQTDTPVADGSLPIDLTTERNNGSDSSTAMDSELTLEREKQLTANEEHRASSDSEAEAEKPDKLQKVKPKPSHNAAAVDTSCSGAKEHQTVTDSSLPIDLTTERSNGSDSSTAMDSELTLEREKQPTANEKHRASSDSEAEAEKPDDFNTELQKVKPKPSHNAAAVDTSYSGAEEHQMVADSSLPIDLTTERSNGSDSSTAMDIDVTLEREKQSTANEEHRASSDSKAEAEDYFNTELQKLQEAQVRPNPSHDAVAVDMRDGGAEERQTDTPVADGSLPINLTTERSNGSDSSTATDLEVTSDKEQRARGLLLPPTFSSNLEAETEKLDDFNSELQKLQEAQVKPKPSHDAAAVDTSDGGAEEHQTDTPVADGSSPNDLSTERSTESDSSTATGLSSGFGSAGGNPFAELAKRSGEFAFGKKDDNHTWPGAGATVFGSGATQNEGEKIHNEAEEEGSDNEVF